MVDGAARFLSRNSLRFAWLHLDLWLIIGLKIWRETSLESVRWGQNEGVGDPAILLSHHDYRPIRFYG